MDHDELVRPADAETIWLQIEHLQDQAEEFELQHMDLRPWDFELKAIRAEKEWRREHGR